MMAQKPLLLKDYLELDSNSDSSNSFFSFPRKPEPCTTVRFLIEIDRCRGGARLIRSRSRGALAKLSAALTAAIKNLPLSSPTSPRPSFSAKRLCSKKFWRKSRTDRSKEVTVKVKDIVRLNSFDLYGDRRSLYFPSSPAASSRSSCSDGEESFLSSSTSGGSSSECFVEPAKSPIPTRRQSPSEEAESKEKECRGCQSEEEKEQLSPVSVMDFPYQDEGDDDDEEKDSPCFEQSLASIERTTHELLQKIRRFESLAQLDPLDLELRFASLEDEDESSSDDGHVAGLSEEITAWDLIRRLRSDCQVDPHSEKLLVDFFLEGLSWSADTTSAEIEGLLAAARDWTNDEGCLKAEDHGKAQLSEMERNGGWRCFEDGRDDVAADVEVRVLGALLQELVVDLAVC